MQNKIRCGKLVSILVLHFRESKEIQFRDATNLSKIVHKFYTEPHTPERICCCLQDQVVFLCTTGFNQGEVRLLDCSATPPKLCNNNEVTHVSLRHRVHDMCCRKLDPERRLLVMTHGDEGVSAYHMETDKLAWFVKGMLPGMEKRISAEGITAGYGSDAGRKIWYYFVSDDKNLCIHMFSSTGEYRGRISNAGEGLGVPRCVRWSSVLESLFVTYINKDGRHQVTKFKPAKNPKNVIQSGNIV